MTTDSDFVQLDEMNARLDRGDERMTRIEDRITENTDLTRDIRDLMDAGRAGLRVLEWIGTAAKWLGLIASACMGVYAVAWTATHGGRPPT